jgi:malonyl-CoA O-methyltransferase
MTQNFDKNLIAKNFSRGAKNYNKLAEPQFQAARRLVELASPFIKNDFEILDLGSGTSFISKKLCADFANKNLKITEVDIAPKMLDSWHERPKNVSTICADMENLSFAPNSFDIIFSSFALHWLDDFEKNFLQFSKLLKKKSYLAFCLPTLGSLDELRLNGVFEFNKFPDNNLLKSALKKCGAQEVSFTCESVSQEFESGFEALKFIKKIGGNSTKSKKIISKTQLENFNNFYLKNSADAESFSISWNISYFIYQI